MFSLNKKLSLVTGAGSGLGQAIALIFARQGATIWIIDRDEAAGRAVVESIKIAGGRADFASLAVSDATATDTFAGQLPPMYIVVNNTGIGHVEDLNGTTPADLDHLYATNVRGAFNVCKAFVPDMLKRKCGSVINLLPVLGPDAAPCHYAYTAKLPGDEVLAEK